MITDGNTLPFCKSIWNLMSADKFDLSRKNLGEPCQHPKNCPRCGEDMSVKGWEIMNAGAGIVLCKACNMSFAYDWRDSYREAMRHEIDD